MENEFYTKTANIVAFVQTTIIKLFNMSVLAKGLLLIVLLSLTQNVTAQQQYPRGIYISFEEIQNRQPSLPDSANVKKRSGFDISMNGGNDYKIISLDNAINKILKRKAWAYSDGDTLYINCRQYKAQKWYAKVLSYGDYLLFDAGMSKLTKKENGAAAAGVMFGAIGGAMAGAAMAQMRFPYAIEVKTNTLHLITLDFIDKVMQSKGAVAYATFQNEKKGVEMLRAERQKEIATETLINKYIPLINATITE